MSQEFTHWYFLFKIDFLSHIVLLLAEAILQNYTGSGFEHDDDHGDDHDGDHQLRAGGAEQYPAFIDADINDVYYLGVIYSLHYILGKYYVISTKYTYRLYV